MPKHSILYLGADNGTSLHRIRALERCGHKVHILNPLRLLPQPKLIGTWVFKTGGMFLEDLTRRRVIANLPNRPVSLVFVDGGELVGPALVKHLQSRFRTVISYNVDDPFGRRERVRWRIYRKSVPFYDLVAVVRKPNIGEAKKAGGRKVTYVHRSADEIAHACRPISAADRKNWGSDVVFVGTWMPERGPFVAKLLQLGVPLSIYGSRWNRAPEWESIRTCWRGPGLDNDDDYAKAIQCAKVCLGFVSKGNRDESTQRSFEIPYLNGLLCAERTAEHRELYDEDKEAVFWDTPQECASKCFELLRNDGRRAEIAHIGRSRCLANGTTNEKVLSSILAELPSPSDCELSPDRLQDQPIAR